MNDLVDELRVTMAASDFLQGGGAAGALIRAHDWTATPLGAPERWPQPLKTLVGVLLAAEQPMFVAWGPHQLLLYNDGYAPMLADRHPAALGRFFFDVWPEVRAELTPLFDRVFAGEPVHMSDIELYLDRPGRTREAHFAFSYTPVRDEGGAVVGLFCPCTETTDQVLSERHRTAEAERQRVLLQQLPCFLAVLQGPDHVYEYVNDAYRELAGRRDFIGRRVRDALPEVAGQGFVELLDGVRASGEPFAARALPIRLDRDDGGRHVDLRCQPVRAPSGAVTGIFVGGYDVTDRVRAEKRHEALLQLDERLGAVVDTADLSFAASELLGQALGAVRVGYGTVDAQARTVSVERNWGAPGLSSVAGVHRFSDYGSYIDDLLRGEPVVIGDVEVDPRTAAKVAAFRAVGVRAFLDVPVVEQGSTVAQIFVHSAVPRAWTGEEIAFVRDFAERTRAVIARRLAEAALRASEEFNRRVLQSSADCIKVLDVEGRLEFMSEGGMCVMEVDDFEAVRHACWPDFWHGEEHPKALAAVREARDGGTGRFQGYATTFKGSPRWWDVAVTPINGADGRPEKLLAVSRDITAARTAEAALRASEARLRAVIEAAPIGLVFGDARGRVTGGNARVEEIVGHPVLPSADVGEYRHWLSFHADGRRVEGHEYPLARVLSGAEERPALEVLYRRGDGRDAWVRFVAAPVRDAESRVVGGVVACLDVDRERRAQARLRELNADLERQVIERTQARGRSWAVSPDLMGALDANGYFKTSNPAWQSVLGWSEDEVGRTPIRDFLHPDDLESTPRDVATTSLGQAAIQFTNRCRRRDGAYRWIYWIGVPDDGLLYCTGRDVTAEKAREAELRDRTAERDRMWELSPDLMVAVDFGGVFRRVNPAWSSILGYPAGDLVGHHVNEFVIPDDHLGTRQAYETAAAGGRPAIENRYRHRDGSVRWISWVAAPASDMTYAVGRDITRDKQRAAELAQAQEQLRQAQKMEAVGQLTGGIAHDFNNLLTGVIGSLEMLQRRIVKGETDKLQRYATMAMTSAHRAAALTHRLLAFSRRQPLDPKPVRANRLVTGMEELLRRTLGEAIALRIVLAGDLWQTRCDPPQLESAILNLAINARDAMPHGGELTIETCNAVLDSAHAARQPDVKPGPCVCIRVTDTGTGMTKDTIERAFEPFFTTKPIGQGTGLGLSMIYGFARQSGGQTRIESEVGRGTTIELYLPRYDGEMEDSEEPPGSLTDAHRAEAGEVVLVVEDETAVRELVVDVLQELGYRAVEAADGPAGLKVLESAMRLDLLVTDIGLPGLNGRQIAEAGRRQRPDLKVLFMTGYAENATLADGFLDRGMEMITKPFAIDALASKVRQMIERG